LSYYIDGRWVRPAGRPTLDVINPADEEVFARISLGTAEDVDQAVGAARVRVLFPDQPPGAHRPPWRA
jgi:aldehyde dehydrogenase (NAD+)